MTYTEIFNQHTLIAGTTGSGKSVLLNLIICDYLNTPNTHLILCDPKKVEFVQYRNCKNVQYFNTPEKINDILRGIDREQKKRYKQMMIKGLKEYDGTKIIIVIDEIADLILSYGAQSKAFVNLLTSLLCTARASGIQFILSTQAPQRKILLPQIQINLPVKCALRCSSAIESRQIINETGAELLPRYGQAIIKSPDFMRSIKINIKNDTEYIQQTIKHHS